MEWKKAKAATGGKGYCACKPKRWDSKDHFDGQLRDWAGKSGKEGAVSGC